MFEEDPDQCRSRAHLSLELVDAITAVPGVCWENSFDEVVQSGWHCDLEAGHDGDWHVTHVQTGHDRAEHWLVWSSDAAPRIEVRPACSAVVVVDERGSCLFPDGHPGKHRALDTWWAA